MAKAQIKLPPKLIPVFSKPLGAYRYRGSYGGRGSGKSFNFAKMAAVFGYMQKLRILCTREFQVSIKESFHAELKKAISSEPWLQEAYDVGIDYIRGKNGTEFIFRGLRNNVNSIKSLAGIDLTIVEEAEDIPEESWLALEATVFRTDHSELWPIWNPRDKDSPTDTRFIKHPPENSTIIKLNHYDNPFFPEGLEALRARQEKMLDPAQYMWIWEGAYLENSELQVFRNWRIEECEPHLQDDLYYGADWGFSQDPTTLLRSWINEATKEIYVDYQVDGVQIEIDHLPELFAKVPRSDKQVIRADNARPETISYINRHGYSCKSVEKGKGSVEDGIEWLKGYTIVVHPRCKLLINELRLYSYQQNKAGDILAKVEDANNHCIDALRYAYEPLIKNSNAGFLTV